jgi:hypothetical protein
MRTRRLVFACKPCSALEPIRARIGDECQGVFRTCVDALEATTLARQAVDEAQARENGRTSSPRNWFRAEDGGETSEWPPALAQESVVNAY